MHVSFRYSQEDLVDATVRFAGRSKTIRQGRRQQLLWSVILVAALTILILRLSMLGAAIAALASLIIVLINPYMYDHRYRKNLRNFYREKFGDEDEFICEVELAPEGLKTGTQSCQSIAEWRTVEDVVPTSDSVDVFARNGGCIVRNRAFGSAEERQQFIDLARDYMIRARGLNSTGK